MFKIIIILLVFLTNISWAQPGLGGGGLTIHQISNKYGHKIDISKDTLLRIRTFDIINDTIYWERFLHEDIKRNKSDLEYKKHIDISPSNYYLDRSINDYCNPQSLIYAIYKKDTMVIDADIMAENHIWQRDFISELKIQQGHFRYKNKLEKISSEINLDFLKDENLPYQYYLSHFYKYYANEKLVLAEEYLDKAVKKNNNKKNCEMLKAFSDLSQKKGNYSEAINYITKVINRKCIPQFDNNQYKYYLNRIDLYTKNKEYHSALKDYDTIAIQYPVDSEHYTKIEIERAYFKLIYLKNYDEIIEEMTSFIKENIDEYRFKKRNPEYYGMGLADGLFVIGASEYFKGNKNKAFKHWFDFFDYVNFQTNAIDDISYFFSDLIDENPLEPELYLCRALCYNDYVSGYYKEENNLKLYRISLKDIAKAEELGCNDHKINYYRSNLLFYLDKEKEAYAEIENALEKKPNDFRCLFLKAQIEDNEQLEDEYRESLKQIDLKQLWFD